MGPLVGRLRQVCKLPGEERHLRNVGLSDEPSCVLCRCSPQHKGSCVGFFEEQGFANGSRSAFASAPLVLFVP